MREPSFRPAAIAVASQRYDCGLSYVIGIAGFMLIYNWNT